MKQKILAIFQEYAVLTSGGMAIMDNSWDEVAEAIEEECQKLLEEYKDAVLNAQCRGYDPITDQYDWDMEAVARIQKVPLPKPPKQ